MGLDMTHDAWHGAYGAFNRYRNNIARAAGYDIERSEGPYGTQEHVAIDWDAYTEANIDGDWGDVVPDDALLYLIVHSDCDGYLEPAACNRLADRLEELRPAIAAIPTEGFGHIGSYAQKTQQLIGGLRDAAANDERLEFH